MTTENVEGFEVTWDLSYIYLKFTDAFGNGEQYSFTPPEVEKIRNMLGVALEKWIADDDITAIPDKIFGTNLPPWEHDE